MQSQLIVSLITRVRIVISAVIFTVFVCGCGRSEKTVFTDTEFSAVNGYMEESGAENEADDLSQGSADSSTGNGGTDRPSEDCRTILVFVCGAVECEGVYELPEGSRVIDAVNAAGGYRDDADSAYINQAEFVYDAEKVEIPTREETRELRGEGAFFGSTQNGEKDDGRININTADLDELMRIPGIGESKAQKILLYRKEHGRFGSAEEIMNISGIGSGNYEKMKDYISVK